MTAPIGAAAPGRTGATRAATQAIDRGTDHVDAPLDVGGGGRVAEREPERAERRRPVDAHRGQHV